MTSLLLIKQYFNNQFRQTVEQDVLVTQDTFTRGDQIAKMPMNSKLNGRISKDVNMDKNAQGWTT